MIRRRALGGAAPAAPLAAAAAPPFAAALALAVTLTAPSARALEEDDPRCAGTHSLFAPLPDACLTVIDTDRPHQTDTPHVVPAGHTQVESALGALALGGALGAAPGDRGAHLAILENHYRFGLVSHTELELAVKHAEYAFARARLAPPGPLSVRAKINVLEQDEWLPTTTLVPWLFVPASPSQAVRGGPLAFFGWDLGHHLELELNAGVLVGASPKPPAAFVVASALTYTIVGELRTFVDVYATGWDVQFGTGVLWAFARDLQVDVGTYVGLSGDVSVATPFLGLSARR